MTAPNPSSGFDLANLLSLLEKQRSLYQSLSDLSRQQAAVIADGRADVLLGILAARQKFIDQISVVNTELEPYRQRWDANWAKMDSPQRTSVGGLVKQVQQLLGEIVEQDERDRNALAQSRTRVQAELQKLNRTSGAINAYRATGGASSPAASAPGVNVPANVAMPARLRQAYPAAAPQSPRLAPRQG